MTVTPLPPTLLLLLLLGAVLLTVTDGRGRPARATQPAH